ncbi:hypothetical protein ABZU76_20930 [Amycolatopsis sp. NPDC005232]|uniref:P-loop ATPase, Sll1717 family n=1 Tax=Amycolatopsis sp. NPDC005232 TaxID=3157027 RepID=UPI0033B0C5A6
MLVREILRELDLGSSVAEQDKMLERYFVETEPFRSVVRDKHDVIAGDKGTGKSALYTILGKRYSQIPEMNLIEVVSAFNTLGTPVFQRLAEGEVLSEQSYINIWKTYFLALAGNWILEFADGDYTDTMRKLDELLNELRVRTKDDTPGGVFSKILSKLKLSVNSAEVSGTGKAGPAEISAKVALVFDPTRHDSDEVEHDHYLRLLDRILADMDVTIWLTVDRLDEAFQGRPDFEKPVLRALFRAYLDMQEFSRVKLKLFVRRDLFRRITSGGFVNLTHVNARKVEIIWYDLDLFDLLHKRFLENESFVRSLQLDDTSANSIFYAVFPKQVDQGDAKPTTWNWMLSRIADGNRVRPPRNLIDLVLKTVEEQLREEEREQREYVPGTPLISPDALKRGLERLSEERVIDTLLAEAGEHAHLIEKFRNGKAEHNRGTLTELLGENYNSSVEFLTTVGFLEPVGTNYKVPMLYRAGLQITQGKAFTP